MNNGNATLSKLPTDRLRERLKTGWPWLLGLAALAYAAVDPVRSRDALFFSTRNLLAVSPVIALGIVLSASVTASGSMALIAATFRGNQVRMIVLASFVGALAPVCGLTVLPLVAGLLAGGVPLAPIMAFWLASPVTDPGMLAVTAGTLGIPFAVGKTVGAFGAGLFGGMVALLSTRAGLVRNPTRRNVAEALSGSRCSCDASDRVVWSFWREEGRRAAFVSRATSLAKLIAAWLFAAFIAEFFLRDALPPDLLGGFVGAENAFAVPLAAIVGAPIYLDGYAALPLVRGLMDAGMAPGAAMAFLVAGGIISAWAAIPVFTLVRLPVFVLYVALATVSAMLAGWTFGALVP